MINTKEWYDHIDELVIRFQAGKTECGEELIEIFQPFFLKYINIVKEGKVNLKDRDSRKFIALFMNDPEVIHKLNKRFHSNETKNNAYKTILYLNNTCNLIDEEDIKQEIYLAFLTLINRWTKKKGKSNFCGYVYNCFRYEFRRAISNLVKDPIVNNTYVNLRYMDSENLTDDIEILDKVNTENTIMITLEEEIDNNWVRGLTCSEEFLSLTTLQRMILKEYYCDKSTDKAIAHKTGLHINTIFRNRTKAIEVLRELYAENY
jgi:RNA polymerase sigma factor (sigma-70 family)